MLHRLTLCRGNTKYNPAGVEIRLGWISLQDCGCNFLKAQRNLFWLQDSSSSRVRCMRTKETHEKGLHKKQESHTYLSMIWHAAQINWICRNVLTCQSVLLSNNQQYFEWRFRFWGVPVSGTLSFESDAARNTVPAVTASEHCEIIRKKGTNSICATDAQISFLHVFFRFYTTTS